MLTLITRVLDKGFVEAGNKEEDIERDTENAATGGPGPGQKIEEEHAVAADELKYNNIINNSARLKFPSL